MKAALEKQQASLESIDQLTQKLVAIDGLGLIEERNIDKDGDRIEAVLKAGLLSTTGPGLNSNIIKLSGLIASAVKTLAAGNIAGMNMANDVSGEKDEKKTFRTLGPRVDEMKKSAADFFTARGFLDKTGISKRNSGGLISEYLDRAEYNKKGFVGPGSPKVGSEEKQQEAERKADKTNDLLEKIAENTLDTNKKLEEEKKKDKTPERKEEKSLLSSVADKLTSLIPTGKAGLGKIGSKVGTTVADLAKKPGITGKLAGAASKVNGASLLKGAKGFGIGTVLGIGGDLVADTLGRDTKAGATADIVGDTASWAGTGAMIGSVVPGVGTAIGAAVGGAAGFAKSMYDNWGTLFGKKEAAKDEKLKAGHSKFEAKGFSEMKFSQNDPENYAKFKKYKAELYKEELERIQQKFGHKKATRGDKFSARMYATDYAIMKFKKEILAAGAAKSIVGTGKYAQDVSPTKNNAKTEEQKKDVKFDSTTAADGLGVNDNVESVSASDTGVGKFARGVKSMFGFAGKNDAEHGLSNRMTRRESFGKGQSITYYDDKSYAISGAEGTKRYNKDNELVYTDSPTFGGFQTRKYSDGREWQEQTSKVGENGTARYRKWKSGETETDYDLGIAKVKMKADASGKATQKSIDVYSDSADSAEVKSLMKALAKDKSSQGASVNVISPSTNTQIASYNLPVRKDDSSLNRYTGSRLSY